MGIFKKLNLILTAILGCLFFSGCVFHVSNLHIIYHDEDRAALEAAQALKLIYFDQNFQAAFDRWIPEFKEHNKADDFKKVVDWFTKKYGKLSKIQSDSYQTVFGKKAIIIFFTSMAERENPVFRVWMDGDGKEGYKVRAIYIQDRFLTGDKPRLPFKKPITITPEKID